MLTKRTSALKEIESEKWKFQKLNDLFEKFIPQFDVTFNRGSPLDLNYYVERKSHKKEYGSFEDEMCELLFDPNGEINVKAYVLTGKVGSGKTSFVRYISEKKFKEKKMNVITIFMDICRMHHNSVNSFHDILDCFYNSVEESVMRGKEALFTSQKDFYSYIMKKLGYVNLTDEWILENAKKHIKPHNILSALASHDAISNILIIIDNIDENSRDTISGGIKFAHGLFSTAQNQDRQQRRQIKTTILLSLRDYNHGYYSTERLATQELPTINEVDVITKRFIQLEKTINDASAKKVSRKVDTQPQNASPGSITYTITKETIHSFLLDLTTALSKEKDFLPLLKNISNGNLKILVNNVYYLLHSNKLPLTPLFSKIFLTKDDKNLPQFENVLPFNKIIECLLAIHYPFYDKDHSLILNIFNANSSPVINDYQNTLVIPRLFSLITNSHSEGIKYSAICDTLSQAAYSKKYIDYGLQKCIDFGIMTSNHGISIDDFSDDTIIKQNSATELYTKKLIYEISYLQYICEDVYMPNEFVVPINLKYHTDDICGDKNKRMEGITKFIDFLKLEEQLERKAIENRGHSVKINFLCTFGVNNSGKCVSISEAIHQEVVPKIKKILSSPHEISDI